MLQDTETVYTSLLYPAILFDWLITLTVFDNVILDKSAGGKSGVYVDFDGDKCVLCTHGAGGALPLLAVESRGCGTAARHY